MGKYKQFKTFIRKKLGLVGVGEFVKDPIYANSKENWNSWFGNKKYLAGYVEPKRLASYEEFVSIMEQYGVFQGMSNVIDCGCGTGHLLLAISKRYPHLTMTGTVFSEESINVSKMYNEKAEFYKMDIYDIPQKENGKYDIVICSEVLEHLLYPNKAMLNLVDLLSDKGVIVLAVPNGRIDTYSGHINFWSPESWKIFIEGNLDNDRFCFNHYLFNNNRNNLTIIRQK